MYQVLPLPPQPETVTTSTTSEGGQGEWIVFTQSGDPLRDVTWQEHSRQIKPNTEGEKFAIAFMCGAVAMFFVLVLVAVVVL